MLRTAGLGTRYCGLGLDKVERPPPLIHGIAWRMIPVEIAIALIMIPVKIATGIQNGLLGLLPFESCLLTRLLSMRINTSTEYTLPQL